MEPAVLARAIANSVCFGVYDGAILAGFGRVVTAEVGFTVGPGPLIYMEHRS